MSTWLWILGAAYVAILAWLSWAGWRRSRSESEYLMAGSNVGVVLGFLTFSATMFSTFTLMGMPDFFRTHGVGAWIFLAVSDGAAFFLILWFGYHLRKRATAKGFRGMAGLLQSAYGNRWAGLVYLIGVFLFLVPYVAIQIRGVAIFLSAAFPGAMPAWGWSVGIVVIMLIYSEIGGLRAIMYSDALQGLTLLAVTWIIALGCLSYFGGWAEMFDQVEAVQPALLSTPGPQGLFTVQFLVASFFAILFLPVTQPQFTTRLMIMKSTRRMQRMAVAVSIFAFLVILPTLIIGMYGAIRYADASTSDFLGQVLLFEQPGIIGAAVILGLVAAAMSTADSQIFALGTELRSLLGGDERRAMRATRAAIVFFAVAALIFAILSSDQLVLLARVSFAGTALLGPMILAGIFSARAPGVEVVALTAVGELLFIGSQVGWVPSMIAGVRMDLLLLLAVGVLTGTSVLIRNARVRKAAVPEMRV